MKNTLRTIYIAITCLLLLATGRISGDEFFIETNCATCCYDNLTEIKLRGELLIWRPELCGVENSFEKIDLSVTADENRTIITTIKESAKKPTFNWNAGFRIGASVALLNRFDVDVDWTHYYGTAKFRQDGNHGHWNIRYDVIDATFGRRFCVIPCFYVKPYIGLRGAQIHHELKSYLQVVFNELIGMQEIAHTRIKHDEDFRGIGPQIGLCAEWALGCDFSIYGSVAAVTYFGDVKNRNINTEAITGIVNHVVQHKKHCFSNLGTDATIGIRWDSTHCICGCDMNFMLKVGAEQHRIYEFSQIGPNGTLNLYGADIGAGISIKY